MKTKNYLLTSLLLAGMAANASAQSVKAATPALPEPQTHATDGITAAKGTATGSRLIGQSYYKYNLSASSFQFVDSSLYRYSNGRGGDLTSNLDYDGQLTVKKGTTTIVNSMNYLQTFDSHGNVTSYISQKWDEPTTVWINQYRYNYYYDVNGKRVIDSASTWNTATSSWTKWAVTVYTRNAAGNITITNGLNWNAATSAWDSGSQVLYGYDANDNIIEYITRTRTAGVLKNSSRNIYTFNPANQCTNIVYQSWNTNSNSWVNTSGYTFVINAHGDRDIQYTQSWNSSGSKWDTSSRYVYAYDAAFNLASTLFQVYVPAGGTWKNSDQYIYASNSSNQRTGYTTKTWNAGGFWELGGSDVSRSYYYESYVPSGVRSLTAGGAMKIWPLPAASVIHLEAKWEVPQPYTAIILDIQGRTCGQWRQGALIDHEVLDVSGLAAGTYILKLQGEKSGVQQQRLTIVR